MITPKLHWNMLLNHVVSPNEYNGKSILPQLKFGASDLFFWDPVFINISGLDHLPSFGGVVHMRDTIFFVESSQDSRLHENLYTSKHGTGQQKQVSGDWFSLQGILLEKLFVVLCKGCHRNGQQTSRCNLKETSSSEFCISKLETVGVFHVGPIFFT